jgi:hypothetical protein
MEFNIEHDNIALLKKNINIETAIAFLFFMCFFITIKAQSNYAQAMQQGDDAFNNQQYKPSTNTLLQRHLTVGTVYHYLLYCFRPKRLLIP